ncbi:MAG: polyphosphate kinase 2 family protein [Alphaproteobacteria bacterium]|nr:polyphosphate kinase 2 family protein [Alphaproteobacteria bacterium]
MYTWTPHPHLVPFDDAVRIGDLPTSPPDRLGKKEAVKELERHVARMTELQPRLYARDTHALLLVFQGMDAAGKDSTIRAVLSGVNPAGCKVWSFKAPSEEELEHDFLWRIQRRLPERGTIGVFNRSHYEELLVVRVHPELLDNARLRSRSMREHIWARRFRSVRAWEQHLADNGTVILKFFLHVSADEQKRRFLDRIDKPEKNWKFNLGDVKERGHWAAYQQAYQEVLDETSRPWAPWYAIPADDKPTMRATIAGIVADTLDRLDLRWPEVDDAMRARLQEMRAVLEKA